MLVILISNIKKQKYLFFKLLSLFEHDPLKERMTEMKDEKKQHILAMGLRLAEATGFEVVGEQGAENYQFLFSQFKKMIENDHQDQLVNKEAKESVLQSLDHTIEFYNAKTDKEVEKLLENLKNDDNTSFMIIPVYKTEKYLHDHVHCLLIHKKEEQYVVTKTDKLHNINSSGNIFEYANFYTKITEKEMPLLSQILFLSKQEHHTESKVDIAASIDTLGVKERKHLAVDWSGYRGIPNCHINEPLATLRIALYNCKHNIFKHTISNRFKPKMGTSKDFHKHFFQTFIENEKEINHYYQALWQIYENRKDKDYCEKVWQEYCKEKKDKGEILSPDQITINRFLANYFLQKTLDHPNTSETIRKAGSLSTEEDFSFFKVFTSDSKELKKWNSYKFLKDSLTNKTIPSGYQPLSDLLSTSTEHKNKSVTQRQTKENLSR